jgi:hypothetical protein
VLNRVLNSSSEPQSSTTYRSFVQRYRECERNAGVQWSIDFNPDPRAWHIVSDDIIYAGSEMNVDTDEFLKSLKSLQVSPCECSAKNPDSDYPNQHTKACPRFQTLHCWCPPATGPGQSHQSNCFQYTWPEPFASQYLKTNSFFGHGLKYQAKLSASQVQAYKFALEWWDETHKVPGVTAVSVILKPGEPGVSITPELEYITKEAVHKVYAAFKTGPFFGHGLQSREMQLQYNYAAQWLGKQKPQSFVHSVAPVAPSVAPIGRTYRFKGKK